MLFSEEVKIYSLGFLVPDFLPAFFAFFFGLGAAAAGAGVSDGSVSASSSDSGLGFWEEVSCCLVKLGEKRTSTFSGFDGDFFISALLGDLETSALLGDLATSPLLEDLAIPSLEEDFLMGISSLLP